MKILFEVVEISTSTGLGTVVIVRKVNSSEFVIHAGLLLNGCEITAGIEPRVIEGYGNLSGDQWGFTLKNASDKARFTIGTVIELSQ